MHRTHFAFALLCIWLLVSQSAQSAERELWTTGRVTGSPEPPLAFRAERTFPKLVFKNPVDIAFAPGSDRAFVVEQVGLISSFLARDTAAKPDVFLDLQKDVKSWKSVPESKGIGAGYGLTFHPQFEKNHYCYIFYVLDPKPGRPALPNGTRISRFAVTGDPPRCDPASEVVLIDWRGGGHNGGCLQFGPDGMLYASAGDAADPNPPDPLDTGQDISDLLSSIIRIDVDHAEAGRNYSIPKDNPFVNTPGARGEVWAYGFRNPWRFSFDRQAGDLWAGDVGWELWEMADHVERGGNYGWSVVEGPQPVHPQGKRGPTPIRPPALSLPHSESASITGGFVYRGIQFPELVGQYVFGDWETRRVWAAKVSGTSLEPYRQIAQTDLRIVGFGQDAGGELYMVDYEAGGIHKLARNDVAAQAARFPTKLSETGLFESVQRHVPAAGVQPISVNAPQWLDGSVSRRFLAVPGSGDVKSVEGKKVFPKDSVLLRTIYLPSDEGDPATRRRVESQLLHFDGNRWHGYSYEWNDDQTDAVLVGAVGKDRELEVADRAAPQGKRKQAWHFPSRAQCLTCHNSWSDYTLAYNEAQLSDEQLKSFREQRLLPQPDRSATATPTLVDPYSESANLARRARSYLHVNCAHCHRFGGGGSALIDLRIDLELSKTGIVSGPAMLGGFGINDCRIVAPGDPTRSVLYYRMAKIGRGRMPHIGSDVPDERGLALIEKWVGQMPGGEAHEQYESNLKRLRAATDATAVTDSIDALLASTGGAVALACEIQSGKLPAAIRQQCVTRAAAHPQEAVRDLFERFIPESQRIARLGSAIKPAELLAIRGDAGRGRKLFLDANAGLCRQCHRAGGDGEEFGPDLSHIATKYDRAKLLESILEPSKTIEPQYVAYLLKTTKGDDYVGLLVEKTEQQVVLKDAQRNLIRVPKDQVKSLTPQAISIMPEGLLGGLTAQQAADLLEYLSTLK